MKAKRWMNGSPCSSLPTKSGIPYLPNGQATDALQNYRFFEKKKREEEEAQDAGQSPTVQETLKRCENLCAYCVVKSPDAWHRIEPIIYELIDLDHFESSSAADGSNSQTL